MEIIELFRKQGLNQSSTSEDIRKAWHTLSLEYHPDRTSGRTEVIFKKINAVYQAILVDRSLLRIQSVPPPIQQPIASKVGGYPQDSYESPSENENIKVSIFSSILFHFVGMVIAVLIFALLKM